MSTNKNKLKLKSGFTLVEILVVISIILVIAAVLLTTNAYAKKNAQDSHTLSQAREVNTALELYKSAHGGYPNPDKDTGIKNIWCVGGDYCSFSSDGGQIAYSNQLTNIPISNFDMPAIQSDNGYNRGILYQSCGILNAETCPEDSTSLFAYFNRYRQQHFPVGSGNDFVYGTTTSTTTPPSATGKIIGTVRLQGFVGTTRNVTFVMSEVVGGVSQHQQTLTLPLTFSGGIASYSIDAPPTINTISAKTDWNLRQRIPILFSLGTAYADFYLLGGDIDGDNAVSSNDYLYVIGYYLQTVGTNYSTTGKADIDGSGSITSGDYLILLGNYYSAGDSVDGTIPPVTTPPSIESFTTSASSVTSGQTVTLSWSSTNSNGCTVSGPNGWTVTLTGNDSVTTQTLSDNPSVFSLTCVNNIGSTDASPVSVVVSTTAPPYTPPSPPCTTCDINNDPVIPPGGGRENSGP